MQTRDFTPYEDELPVNDEFIDEHDGERIGVTYVMPLDILIEVAGIDDMNDYLDTVSGVILTDIEYSVATPGPDDELGKDHILILATGDMSRHN